MTLISTVHLLDDFELGGVLKSLRVFTRPEVAAIATHRILPVAPARALAPRLAEDIIVTHFPPSWKTLSYLISLRMRNRHAKLVHVEHSYTGAWESLKVPNGERFRRMLRIAYALFDAIVAVSEGQARWLREVVGLADARVSVIHSWSGPQRLDQVAPVTAAIDRPIMLGAYGRFAEQKGFDTLIAAMRQVPADRFQLLIGGFGPEEARLRALAVDAPNVRFVGKVNDVGGFLGQCDIVVVPSRWEAFGQVATEAREAGRSILVADVDGLPEQAAADGVVADCREPAALARAIRALADLDLADMGARARRSVADCGCRRAARWATLLAQVQAQPGREARIARSAQPISSSAGQYR